MTSARQEGSKIRDIVERSRLSGQRLLAEPEGLEVLAAIGIEVPASVLVATVDELNRARLDRIPGEQVVLKVVSPGLAHKTELGGVRILDRDPERIRSAAERMKVSLGDRPCTGFLVQERVESEGGAGTELLIGCRRDREFGAILTVGSGGELAERLAADLKEERALAVVSLELLESGDLTAALRPLAVVRLLTDPRRGRPAILRLDDLSAQIRDLCQAISELLSSGVEELEMNPAVVRDGRLVALDVLVRVAPAAPEPPPPRPVAKLRQLLEPESIGVVGVSRGENVGHRILANVLAQGFDPSRVVVVKPGIDEIEGCRCVAEVDRLSPGVDLLIIAVSAPAVPAILDRVLTEELAESVIIIPGGFGETTRSKLLVERVMSRLAQTRGTDWGGPVINGGNCMGIRSVPGRYDTFFLPDYKLPPMASDGGMAALVAQSGAFLAARSSKLEAIPFRYQVSIGNQLDLTVGDYLQFLSTDAEVSVAAFYVEGFKILDGLQFLAAAKRMAGQHRTVILYRAGRSRAGRDAAASHTAAIAGSYRATVGLSSSCGVLLVDSLADFEDLVSLAVKLEDRSPVGRRLAGLSNAGFECVTLSDRLGGFDLALLTDATGRQIDRLLRDAQVENLVDVRNPLDVTPMVGDRCYSQIVEKILNDPEVDIGVVGCVPLTGALQTLSPSSSHVEDLDRVDAVGTLLIDLWRRTDKPWVVVVDGGRPYDRFAARLDRAGIPVFRTMDRAVQMLDILRRHRERLITLTESDSPQG